MSVCVSLISTVSMVKCVFERPEKSIIFESLIYSNSIPESVPYVK